MMWYRFLSRTVGIAWYAVMCFASLAHAFAGRSADSDGCDHTIWDNTLEPKGVRNIVARCSEGRLMWKHPYGALRVTLQLTHSAGTKPLKACIKSTVQFTFAKISLENSQDLKTLVTLDPQNPSMGRELCLEASSGVVTLYVEAQATDLNSLTIGEVSLDYDLQEVSTQLTDDIQEECRPCTEQELLTAYCSSDFVVRGSMGVISHDISAGETEISVKAGKIYRQKTLIFKRSSLSSRRSSLGSYRYKGSVVGAYKCGIQRGDGLFLFMGRIRLDRAILHCAPRLEDFQSMWKTASEEGRAPCAID